jgi:hypothetical protein
VGPSRERAPRVPPPPEPLGLNPQLVKWLVWTNDRLDHQSLSMARIAAVVEDLMLASRVRASLEAAGHEVEQDSALPDELDGVDCVVADLDAVPPERLSDLGLPVIGFYQHTDTETKQRADRAGLAMAVPRSRMVRELPELVERVLG